jgi:peptide/nickel transport system substrate-binding protein
VGRLRFVGVASVLVTLLVGCAGPPPAATQRETAPQSQAARAPKRVTAAINGDPFTLNSQLNSAGGNTVPGVPEIEQMVHAGLSVAGDRGLRPQLAEAIPTTENSLWKVLPDGRMETTWRIREGAHWHDGTPFTAQDLVFTATVVQDRELVVFRNRNYDLIEAVEALDPRTVVVRWSRPFVNADSLFGGTAERLAMPLPRHLLEAAYVADKSTFTELPYWSQDFVGAGPYRLASWVRESHLILEANDRYVLGRPRLDQIEIRFIVDINSLMAAVLAGTVELTLGRGLGIEQAVQVRDQWSEGRLVTGPARWVFMAAQFLTPSPSLVTDVQFRRALLHGTDRQALVDTFQKGLTTVADSILEPNQPQYREIEARLPRYEYDPRRTAQIMEALGYARSADGGFRDAGGQRLSFELRTPNVGPNEKLMLAIVDNWQRIGLGAEPQLVPRQRFSDNEYRWTFPGFELTKRPHDVKGLGNFYSSQAPLPENRFLGNNIGRYMSPELDGLLDRYFTTIPTAPRIQALSDIVRHFSDVLPVLGLFYDPEPTLIGDRLEHVTPVPSLDATVAWNVETWDVR